MQAFRLDPPGGEQLQEQLAGRDHAAAVAPHVDDEPVLGQQAQDAFDLVDELERRHPERADA